MDPSIYLAIIWLPDESVGFFMLTPLAIVSIFLACAGICFVVAKKRGANTRYWLLMGALVGPLAIPFVFFSKPMACK